MWSLEKNEIIYLFYSVKKIISSFVFFVKAVTFPEIYMFMLTNVITKCVYMYYRYISQMRTTDGTTTADAAVWVVKFSI